MPRTIDEIISQAEELATGFENHEPNADDIKDASALRELRQAFLARAEAEQHVTEASRRHVLTGTHGPPSEPWSAHRAKPPDRSTVKVLQGHRGRPKYSTGILSDAP